MKLSTKSTVEKYPLLLWMLQNVPPILISAGAGRRANPKNVNAGTTTCGQICAFGLIICSIVSVLNELMAPHYLHQPWSKADIIYIAMAVIGSGLRIHALASLSRQNGTCTARDHQLVQTGFYRFIRHPGYAGNIMGLLGFLGFLGLRPPGLIWTLAFALPVTVYMAIKIPHEEQILHEHYGEAWEHYSRQTWRLLPLIF
ncbi:g6269 [Coccomyxa viridis]|uniref:Protein-S-isoprenylcysteine O-methyltransferase n=1 Tax=Coccomyxa viridis TaxID=1274662 RepID=A0ABP1FUZ2_9CHLO